jgi:hypothetical protein
MRDLVSIQHTRSVQEVICDMHLGGSTSQNVYLARTTGLDCDIRRSPRPATRPSCTSAAGPVRSHMKPQPTWAFTRFIDANSFSLTSSPWDVVMTSRGVVAELVKSDPVCGGVRDPPSADMASVIVEMK